MTKLISNKIAGLAGCLVGGVIVLSCFAGVPAAGQDSSTDFSHVVDLEGHGDSIKIQEVRGPSDMLVVGNTYEVRGTYKLVSRDKAVLAVNVSADASQPHTSHSDVPTQKMIVEKGEGSFTLQFHYVDRGPATRQLFPGKGRAWLCRARLLNGYVLSDFAGGGSIQTCKINGLCQSSSACYAA